MKRTTIVLILGAIIATNYYCKVNNLSIPKITNTVENEQARIDKLNLLQTREYAQNALKRIGSLNVLEGKYHYSNTVKDEWLNFTLKQMTLDMEYKFAIGLDLQYINVRSTFDKIIVLQLPKDKLELQYIELDTDKSRIVNDKKIFLVSDFKPSEVEVLLEESQYNVAGKINNDNKLFDQAMDNLKSELEKLTYTLGYNETIFEVI